MLELKSLIKKKNKKILIACEESQAITIEFRKLGYEAFSCDLQDCSGGHPEWHIKGDVMNIIDQGWDLMIAHPPCTYMASSGVRWLSHPDDKDLPFEKRRPHPKYPLRRDDMQKSIKFVKDLYNSNIKYVAIENPIGVLSTQWRKPDQIIQPWQFGHGETKATCLWLKNLPLLQPTNIVEGREQKMWKLPPSEDRGKLRSKTYKGIAEAIAIQWSKILEQNESI